LTQENVEIRAREGTALDMVKEREVCLLQPGILVDRPDAERQKSIKELKKSGKEHEAQISELKLSLDKAVNAKETDQVSPGRATA
jgi:hypothetical protein